jgi:hypothetical protein
MASKNFAGPDRSLMRGIVKVQGSFIGAGGANPTGIVGNGITSIAWTALGRYLVTFSGQYRRMVAFNGTVLPGTTGTNAGTVALARCVTAMQPLQTTVSGRKVTQVEIFITNNTGTEALVDVAASTSLVFEATFQNSIARPSRGR